ncbi:formylglycine-generating enzyme [Gammaproteobacteria bacterium]
MAQGTQTIGAISFTPSTLVTGGTTTASATATSGLSVIFSSTTPAICTTGGTDGSVVTAVAAGNCTVAASQVGDLNWKPATQVTQGITIAQSYSFEPEMLSIPAGSFRMGSASNVNGNERPHQVTVAAFGISKFEITFDEYDYFANATSRRMPNDQGWGRGSRPVVDVNWNDATAYAQWLSTQTGRSYRLPTEAEWEYAARAGTTREHWWGDSLESNRANCDNGYCGDAWQYTAPVGSFAANPWGLYDTVGNVWEWTCSAYDSSYSGGEKVCQTTGDADRVIRGGSWGSGASNARVALRDSYAPGSRGSNVGFRLVRTPF